MSLLSQPDAGLRLALTRITAAVAVIRYTAHLPGGETFAALNRFAADAGDRGGGPGRYARRIAVTKAFTIASVAAWGAGLAPQLSGPAAVAGFTLLNREVALGLPGFASYTTHLNFLLAASAASDSHQYLSLAAPSWRDRPAPEDPAAAGRARLQTTQLAVMQVFVGSTYTQAGLSKVLHGGHRWVSETNTLGHALSVYGTPAGRRLARRLWLMRPMAAATVGFETGFLPALVAGSRHKRWLGLAALGFHASTKRYMDISFWHLAWFHLPLFVLPTSISRHRRRRGSAQGSLDAHP